MRLETRAIRRFCATQTTKRFSYFTALSSNNFSFRREDAHIATVIESKEFEEVVTELIKKYIKHYTMLTTFCQSTEDFLSPILFLKIQSRMFSVIFIAFTIITVILL